MVSRTLFFRLLGTLLIGGSVMAATFWCLRPAIAAESDYKFMHCDVCHQELAYNSSLAGKPRRCEPPKIGMLIPTRRSIKDGHVNPWWSLNVAMSFEAVCLLGAVVYLLYHPPRRTAADYHYIRCPNCDRKLRYRAERAGEAAGWCPACKAMFVYPSLAEPSSS